MEGTRESPKNILKVSNSSGSSESRVSKGLIRLPPPPHIQASMKKKYAPNIDETSPSTLMIFANVSPRNQLTTNENLPERNADEQESFFKSIINHIKKLLQGVDSTDERVKKVAAISQQEELRKKQDREILLRAAASDLKRADFASEVLKNFPESRRVEIVYFERSKRLGDQSRFNLLEIEQQHVDACRNLMEVEREMAAIKEAGSMVSGLKGLSALTFHLVSSFSEMVLSLSQEYEDKKTCVEGRRNEAVRSKVRTLMILKEASKMFFRALSAIALKEKQQQVESKTANEKVNSFPSSIPDLPQSLSRSGMASGRVALIQPEPPATLHDTPLPPCRVSFGNLSRGDTEGLSDWMDTFEFEEEMDERRDGRRLGEEREGDHSDELSDFQVLSKLIVSEIQNKTESPQSPSSRAPLFNVNDANDVYCLQSHRTTPSVRSRIPSHMQPDHDENHSYSDKERERRDTESKRELARLPAASSEKKRFAAKSRVDPMSSSSSSSLSSKSCLSALNETPLTPIKDGVSTSQQLRPLDDRLNSQSAESTAERKRGEREGVCDDVVCAEDRSKTKLPASIRTSNEARSNQSTSKRMSTSGGAPSGDFDAFLQETSDIDVASLLSDSSEPKKGFLSQLASVASLFKFPRSQASSQSAADPEEERHRRELLAMGVFDSPLRLENDERLRSALKGGAVYAQDGEEGKRKVVNVVNVNMV
eukprot:GDKJ01012849.1.p1 GENE.GDKJ01012849.1~~GDKJ01012849.1.p1  ORF type:complete len:708 (-),score=172.72 GDKJ01012849.1:1854-3977(-)